MEFTYIINDSHDPRHNLALEETLLEKAEHTGEGFLMLWSNDPAVIVGRYQNAAEEVNVPFVRERGIRVVRRVTGGGAVYHDCGVLNYTVITQASEEEALNVKAFGAPLLGFLRSLGVDARTTGRNDVTVEGHKVSGAALHSRNDVVLYHGSILFDVELENLERSLLVKPDKFLSKGFKSVRSRVANLRRYLGETTFARFRDDFAASLRAFYGAVASRRSSPDESAKARALADGKYGTDAWTWGQSPNFSMRTSRRFPAGEVQFSLIVEGGCVTACRISGDFFSNCGVEDVERLLIGSPYPFGSLSNLDDALLTRAFLNIPPHEIRALFRE